MLIKTRGIVFKTLKYSETSLILDIYTEEKGLKKYIISGVRNKASKLKTGILQLASLVEMVAYFRENKDLHRIKEIKSAHIYQSIPFELMKGTVALFMIELARKTVKEEEANADLFDFLYSELVRLDEMPILHPDFHIHFMLELSRFLGFLPAGNWSEDTPFFDMREGLFVKADPLHQYALNKELSAKIGQLLKKQSLQLTRKERQLILNKLIDYFRIHVDNFKGLNTHAILKEVLEG